MVMNLETVKLAASSLLLRSKLRVHHVSFGYHLVGNYSAYIKNKGKIELGNRVYLFSKPEGHSCKTALITENKDNREQGRLHNYRQQLFGSRCNDFCLR